MVQERHSKNVLSNRPGWWFWSLASAFYPPLDDQVMFLRVKLEKNSNLEALLETDFFLIFNHD